MRIKLKHKLIFGTVLVFSVLYYFTGYWSPENRFTIVDAETGLPIEGAIVVINWDVDRTGLAGSGGHVDSLAVFESVSDKNGEVVFPEWGRRWNKWYLDWAVDMTGPVIRIFKPGYRFKLVANRGGASDYPKKASYFNMVSEWNEKKIELKPYAGTDEGFMDQISEFSSSLLRISYRNMRKWDIFIQSKKLINDLYDQYSSKGIIPKFDKIIFGGEE